MSMSPHTRAWREQFIRYCALRLRYHRVWQSSNANICDLAALLSRVEEAEYQCRALAPERENAT